MRRHRSSPPITVDAGIPYPNSATATAAASPASAAIHAGLRKTPSISRRTSNRKCGHRSREGETIADGCVVLLPHGNLAMLLLSQGLATHRATNTIHNRRSGRLLPHGGTMDYRQVIFVCFAPVRRSSRSSPPSSRPDPDAPMTVFKVDVVAKTAKAINYRHRSGATKIDFKGTANHARRQGRSQGRKQAGLHRNRSRIPQSAAGQHARRRVSDLRSLGRHARGPRHRISAKSCSTAPTASSMSPRNCRPSASSSPPSPTSPSPSPAT